ncbi:MAG: hypothetical protein H0U74_05010 [Bradymonadaceae bacterium]|nr:hypothetical protein [Lujinxingiaceae bacterium]
MVALLAVGCGEDELELAALLADESVVLKTGVLADSGPVGMVVRVQNIGADAANIYSVEFDDEEQPAGIFRLDVNFSSSAKVAAGAELNIPVIFERATNAPGRCDFMAISTLRINYLAGQGQQRELRIRLVVTDDCPGEMRCAPANPQLPDTVRGQTSRLKMGCANFAQTPVLIEAIELVSTTGPIKLEFASASPPRELVQGDVFDFELIFSPEALGEVTNTLRVRRQGGANIDLNVRAEGIRPRPLCSQPAPQAPAMPADIDGYTFDLESDAPVNYHGVVADLASISESYAPMLHRAVLIATGAYLSDYCTVSNTGASFRWEGLPCTEGDGTLYNVLGIGLSEAITAQILSAAVGDNVRFEGYDIERIKRAGYWQDGGMSNGVGNRAMFISRVCDLE